MPDVCAANGCSNRRGLNTRTRGITFHLFPKTRERRRMWEFALGRDGFIPSDRTLLCSEHFRSEDFDRTGQTVRLRDGAVPTIFNFPDNLQNSVATRNTTISETVEDNLPLDLSKHARQPDVQGATGGRTETCEQHAVEHLYALPACPAAVKAKLESALERVRILQREKSNALKRERRAKKTSKIIWNT